MATPGSSKRARTASVAPPEPAKRSRLTTQTSMGPPVSPASTPSGSQTRPNSTKQQQTAANSNEESAPKPPATTSGNEDDDVIEVEDIGTRVRLKNSDGSEYSVPRRIFDISQATKGKDDFGGRARVVISLLFFAQRSFSIEQRHDLLRQMVPKSVLMTKNMESFAGNDIKRKIERTATKLKDSLELCVAAFKQSDVGLYIREVADEIARKEGRYNHPDERVNLPETVADIILFEGRQGLSWTKGDVVQCFKRILVNTKQRDIVPEGYIDWFFGDVNNWWLEKNSLFLLGCILAIYRHEGPLGKDMNDAILKSCFDMDVFEIPDDIHWPEPNPAYEQISYEKAGNDTRALKNIKVFMDDNMGNSLHHYVDGALVLAASEEIENAAARFDYEDEDDMGDGSAQRPFKAINLVSDAEDDQEPDDSFNQDDGWYDRVKTTKEAAISIPAADIEEISFQVLKEHQDEDAAVAAKIAKDGLVAAHVRSSRGAVLNIPPVIPKSITNQQITPLDQAWLNGDTLQKIRLMNRYVQQDTEVAKIEMLRCYFGRKNIEKENLELQKTYLTLMKLRRTLSTAKGKLSEDQAEQRVLKKLVESERKEQAISEEDLRMFEDNFGFVRPKDKIDFSNEELFDDTNKNLDKLCEDLARYDGVPKPLPTPNPPAHKPTAASSSGNGRLSFKNTSSFRAALDRHESRPANKQHHSKPLTQPVFHGPTNSRGHGMPGRPGNASSGLRGQSDQRGPSTPVRNRAPSTPGPIHHSTPRKLEPMSPPRFNPGGEAGEAIEVPDDGDDVRTESNDEDEQKTRSLGSPFDVDEGRMNTLNRLTNKNSFDYGSVGNDESGSGSGSGNGTGWDDLSGLK
ncbi:hypothetical protein BJ508DRAFT_330678 [Ascobolus immersus RN42]|uniref:Uncharacterized protein n=1 Tax=Ascobolus immersus RN42 TaxID=1160509 RepID=A0A3N4HY76_ASCIM|nr:hypothetical protein BJ508DRAFT_330678 [Ascobolus immersus RN42]